MKKLEENNFDISKLTIMKHDIPKVEVKEAFEKKVDISEA